MGKKYDMSGLLYRNTRRENDRQPEFRGKATVEGQDYWLSAWVKENDKGKFFSIKFEPVESSGEENQDRGSAQEDVPF